MRTMVQSISAVFTFAQFAKSEADITVVQRLINGKDNSTLPEYKYTLPLNSVRGVVHELVRDGMHGVLIVRNNMLNIQWIITIHTDGSVDAGVIG